MEENTVELKEKVIDEVIKSKNGKEPIGCY